MSITLSDAQDRTVEWKQPYREYDVTELREADIASKPQT